MEEFKEKVDKFKIEFNEFVKKHANDVHVAEKLKADQIECQKVIKHNRLLMKTLLDQIEDLKSTKNVHEKFELAALKDDFEDKELILREIEDYLPKKNGLYLGIVLGGVNVSFTNKMDKFAYKNNYENFKIVVSAILAIVGLLLYLVIQIRVMDSLYHFLFVWYYCTLTIRERILIQNGSRIKGWWATYHFILTAEASIMLIWPHSESYTAFRDQFMLYGFYISIVQCIQYYYQVGCLYKLRALGERPSMDITVDGYMSWMSKRFSFVLLFLFAAYAFQIYNAYTLFLIAQRPSCNEWQPICMSFIYTFTAFGNLLTTLYVIGQKISKLTPVKENHLIQKYSMVNNYELENDICNLLAYSQKAGKQL